jgi:hypothetical protein
MGPGGFVFIGCKILEYKAACESKPIPGVYPHEQL